MKAIILLLLVTIAEATIGIFVKLSGDDLPIFALNFYRVLFATVFLGAAMLFVNKNFWKFPKNNWRDILLIGLLIAGQISLYNLAMRTTTVASAVIFWSIAPFFVFLFSWWFLGEPAKKRQMLIFGLALVGLVIANPFGGGNAFGNAIALLTGVVYAAAVTYMRHEGKTESSNDVFWFMAVASLFLLPGALLAGSDGLLTASSYSLFGLGVPTIFWVLCLGMISTGAAYFFISLVLKKINANLYSLVDIIVSPVIAAVLAFLVFSEVPATNVMIGGGVLLTAGFWLTRTMKSDKKQHYRELNPPSVK